MQVHTGITSAMTRLNLNAAREWRYVGHAVEATVGAIVVWPHHVGQITGRDEHSGRWIIPSGNDGHRVRSRPRSLGGAIALRAL
jgi:hypothetical protein